MRVDSCRALAHAASRDCQGEVRICVAGRERSLTNVFSFYLAAQGLSGNERRRRHRKQRKGPRNAPRSLKPSNASDSDIRLLGTPVTGGHALMSYRHCSPSTDVRGTSHVGGYGGGSSGRGLLSAFSSRALSFFPPSPSSAVIWPSLIHPIYPYCICTSHVCCTLVFPTIHFCQLIACLPVDLSNRIKEVLAHANGVPDLRHKPDLLHGNSLVYTSIQTASQADMRLRVRKHCCALSWPSNAE